MKLTTVKIVIVMTLILGVAGIATCENKPNAFTVSPFIGGHLFEGDQNLEHGFSAGVGIGYNFDKTWGVEGVVNYINTETLTGDNNVDGFLYRVDGLYHFNPYGKILPYVAAGVGGISLHPKNGDNDLDLLINYGAGVKYFINDIIMLRGDIRHIVSFDDTHHNLAYTLGLAFLFDGKKEKKAVKQTPQIVDSDGDGVNDNIDRCQNTPAGVEVNSFGCPFDTDEDGVHDYLDKCPDTPKDMNVDSDGCTLDNDGDGIYDSMDQCPDTPADVVVDLNGCPMDSDRDGVYDYLDKCPETLKGMEVDLQGCPLDGDGDGVYNSMDQCPNTPKGASVNSYGCWVIEGTSFASAKCNIKPDTYEILDEVAMVCKQNPLLKIEIQGHSDNRGSKRFNTKLSEKRAKAVMKYLVEKGVEQDRLSAKGFGFAKPIAPNDTPEGRAENRRVELMPIRD